LGKEKEAAVIFKVKPAIGKMDSTSEVHRVYDLCEQGAAAPCSIAVADFLDELYKLQ